MEKLNMSKWFDDLDSEKVSNASEIPQQIDLPEPDETGVMVKILSEPEQVEVKSRKGEHMTVCNVEKLAPEPVIQNGTIILGKSLKFNIAKALTRNKEDYTKVKLTGRVFRIWSVLDDGNKYYQCEMIPSE